MTAPDRVKTGRNWQRIALVLVMAGSYWASLVWKGSLVDLLLHSAYGPIVQFAPAVLAADEPATDGTTTTAKEASP